MSHCHPCKFSKTGGKCPTVILANFQKREEIVRLSSWQIFKKGGKCPTVILANFHKWEENVRLSSWQIFTNGRKMSDCHPGNHRRKMSNSHSDVFSKIGGKCALVILVIFQKYLHKEENVQYAIWLFFQQRWKLSFSHNGKFFKNRRKIFS